MRLRKRTEERGGWGEGVLRLKSGLPSNKVATQAFSSKLRPSSWFLPETLS